MRFSPLHREREPQRSVCAQRDNAADTGKRRNTALRHSPGGWMTSSSCQPLGCAVGTSRTGFAVAFSPGSGIVRAHCTKRAVIQAVMDRPSVVVPSSRAVDAVIRRDGSNDCAVLLGCTLCAVFSPPHARSRVSPGRTIKTRRSRVLVVCVSSHAISTARGQPGSCHRSPLRLRRRTCLCRTTLHEVWPVSKVVVF